jgi:hypothetical protein
MFDSFCFNPSCIFQWVGLSGDKSETYLLGACRYRVATKRKSVYIPSPVFKPMTSNDLRPTLASLSVTLNAMLSVSSATFYWKAMHDEYSCLLLKYLYPFTDQAQTALFKDPVRTAL